MKYNIFFCNSPPHNILAEELFIGTLLLNFNLNILIELHNEICVEALILESHQIIYRTILHNTEKSRFSLTKLIRYLSEKKLLHKVGGLNRILELVNQALVFQRLSIQTLLIRDYVTVIQNKYIRRLIIQWATYIITLGLSDSIKLDLLLQQANKYIEKIFLLRRHNNTFSLSTTLKDLIDNFHLPDKGHTYGVGIKCGLKKLDTLTQGFQPADLIIIAGRPGMGKTSVALNIITYVLKHTKQGVVLFSFEMSKKQILYRLLAIQSAITVHRLRNGSINNYELNCIKRNCQILTKSFFYIDDDPNTTILELYFRTKEIAEKYTTGLIIIDYLQLIQNSNSQFDNRVQELSSITRILKILARETLIPLIVLSQLNRNVEGRTNKRPLLSDLRESGCLQGNMYLAYKYKRLKIQETTILFANFIESIKNKHNIVQDCCAKKFSHNLQFIYNLQSFHASQLHITENHKILTFSGWKQESNLFSFDTITVINNSLHTQPLGNKFLGYYYLFSITWHTHKLIYDIKTNNLLNFHVGNTILHNSIEQDADLVLLLYRNDYYTNTSSNLAEIIIAKHRNGPTGNFELRFDASCTIFTNY